MRKVNIKKIRMRNDNAKYKIIFCGTSDFAVPALKSLLDLGYGVIAVITRPDKPAGRKKILTPPPIKIAARELGLKVLQPSSLELESGILNLEFDLGVVASYGKMIPKKYLDIPKYGFVNIHPSLLPKYRGPSPIQTAILNGDRGTGVAIIKIDEEMDHGPVLAKREFSIFNFQFSNRKELEKELAELGAELLAETLPEYLNGGIVPEEQDHSRATFTKMFSREDGKIDWGQTAEKIYNQIRALNPEPGTWSAWNGKTINIKKASLLNNRLVIEIIQPEGKKEMAFEDFIQGHPDFPYLK